METRPAGDARPHRGPADRRRKILATTGTGGSDARGGAGEGGAPGSAGQAGAAGTAGSRLDGGVDRVATDADAGCGQLAATCGAIHVAWVLKTSVGSPTDCISAATPNIEISITNASQIRVVWSVNYCVDMKETFRGLAPGDYSIQLSLPGNRDGGVAATATATATVTAGSVADGGTLTLLLVGP